MAETQYDMSPKMQELFKKKQEQRAAAKEYYRKQVYNPYNQSQPVDPVLFRYIGMSAYSTTHYKPSIKRKVAMFFVIAPMFLLGWIVKSERDKREKELWSGNVAYADRENKLLY